MSSGDHQHHQHGHHHAHGASTGAPVKYRKQEQEPASTEVTEVAPGILRMQLPIHLPGLGHVNCYALEDEDGFALVDPGMPGPKSWRELQRALQRAGIPLARVHTAIVTHSHPDHFGGAGKLRREVGAKIVAHHSFRVWWSPAEPNDDVDAESQAQAAADRAEVTAAEPGRPDDDVGNPWTKPAPWGGPAPGPPRRRRLRWQVLRMFPSLMPTPTPTTRLRDAQTIRFARREWVAVHTPGHTADHLCLFDPSEGVFLSGDHVLPTITPHISGLVPAPDPLREFFDSLDKARSFHDRVGTVLPAHGHPFTDLAGRVDAIKHHHEDRLDRLKRASGELGRGGTVPEFSHYLFSARAQGPMADSETYAHLEHLRLLGEAEAVRRSDGMLEYHVG